MSYWAYQLMAVTCPHCGASNDDWASFCTNCGRALPKSEAAPAATLSYEEVRGRERTRTGLLLLVIGFVLAAIPFVNVVAVVLLIVAAILLLLGADAFGARHRSFVVASVVLFIVLVAAVVYVFASFFFQLFLGGLGAPVATEAAWRGTVIGVGILSAGFAVPYLLVTHELQDITGRQVLWGAAAVEVAVAGVEIWYLLSLSGAGPADLAFLGALTANPITYLFALTALPWAYAYYRAYRRVATPPLVPSSPGAA